MSSSKENNDYPQDDNFKRFGSLLSPFKKKGKKNKNNVTVKESEIPKTEEDIQVDNVSMIAYKEPVQRNLQCVNKLKSEVYEEMVLLIHQNELNLTERSYKLKHLKDAFNIFDDKHKEILEKVAHKPSEHKEKEEVQHDDSSSSGSKFYNLPEEISIHHLEEHSELLQTFLEYDLRFLNIQRYHWNGEYCEMVQKLLSLHAKDRGLNDTHVLHAKWIAYTKIHENHPISLNSFLELLNSLTDLLVSLELNQQHDNISLKTKQVKIGFRRPTISDLLNIVSFGSENATCGITETDASENGKCKLKYVQPDIVSAFWNSTENLVEIFSKFIRNLHLVSSDEEKVSNVDILKEAFSIFDKIESICMPANEQPINFRESVKESLSRGVSEHLAKNANQSVLSHGNKNDSRIEELIRLIKLSQSYLLKFTSEYKDTFESYLNVDFPEHMYRNYDKELTIIIKPIVLNICESEDGNIEEFATNHKPVAKNLFELYRELKKFADYGVEKFVRCDYEMSDYYSWFLAPISKCRKISVFSILPRLETAVKEDNLRPDKEEINVSSSANDLLVLLHDIKKFWEYLQMTGSKEDYTKFIAGDFYRFTTKYFEQFVIKIENSLDINDFDKVALTLSVALANHNYVKEKMIQLQTDLTRGDEYDVSNVQSIIRYTIKYIETAITQLMIAVTKKYYTSIRGKIEADVNGNEKSESIEMEVTCESVGYVEKILSIVPESASREFETLKSALWQNIYEITNEMIKHANHPPLFYSKLHIVFSKLKNIFFGDNIQPETKKKIENIEYYLECYEYKLSRLIHEYYKERFVKQQIIPQEVANSLTVNTFISDNVLTLKIIGTNELFKSNKKVEPQLTIKIIPENYFQSYQNIRLRLSQDAFDPIKIQLTKEQRHMKDAIIYFKIETRNLVRSKSLFAEAFLSFENIPVHDFKKSIEDINLMLNKLTTEDLETLEAIRKESDKGDKEAKKFLDRIKLQI